MATTTSAAADAVAQDTKPLCVEYFNQLSYCMSPANQMSTYYRSASIDSCQEDKVQLKMCLAMKLPWTPPEDKQRILKELKEVNIGQNARTKDIWEMRTDIEADWKALGKSSQDGVGQL